MLFLRLILDNQDSRRKHSYKFLMRVTTMSRISFKSYVASLDAEKLSKLNYVEDPRYHYVYRITNVVEGKHYYGSRTSSVSPELDIGIEYHSTATTNSWIIEDQKINPQNYKYKIIRSGFNTRTEANLFEAYLHKTFDVQNHELFYNVNNQNPYGFDITGNKEIGRKISETKSDPEWKETVGKNSTIKFLETISSQEWKNTIGVSRKQKEIVTKSDPVWKSMMSQKISTVRSDLNWKNSVGKEASKKMVKTRTQNKSYKTGSEHRGALKIEIYDNLNTLVYVCHGNFKSVCENNELPYTMLMNSYKNNGEMIIKSRLKKYEKFIGWKAIIAT